MPFCPQCGDEIEVDAQFCSSCGYHISKSVPNTEKRILKKRKKSIISILFGSVFMIAVCAVVGIVFLSANKTAPFSDNPEQIEKTSASVVLLECYDKDGGLYCTGSAFAAFEDGIFVTNYHVIEQNVYRIIATAEDSTSFEIASVLAYDQDCDLAILKTQENPGISPLLIGQSSSLSKGEKVVAIGSPLGLLNTVSTGVFSGYIDNNGMNEIQFTASISHGSSGGVLLNDAGEVIGVTYASYSEGQNLNMAIPIEKAVELRNLTMSEMTISDFYNTFEHNRYFTVDDILLGKDILLDDSAYVSGIVADIDENNIYLVSKEEYAVKIQELKMDLPDIPQDLPGKNYWETQMSIHEKLTPAEKEAGKKYHEYRDKYSILVKDLTKNEQIIQSIHIGDTLCVKMNWVGEGISIYNADNVSIISK